MAKKKDKKFEATKKIADDINKEYTKVKVKTQEEKQAEIDKQLEIKLGIEHDQLIARIDEHFPKVLLKAMHKYTGCECKLEGVIYFMDALNEVTPEVSAALIQATHEVFQERVKKTSCGSCLNNRINRLREHFRLVLSIPE